MNVVILVLGGVRGEEGEITTVISLPSCAGMEGRRDRSVGQLGR